MRWSPPEQNASSPAPVKMIAATSRSSRARANASRNSARVCGRKAFLTSGRLIVIFAIPSVRSYRMSSKSPALSHSTGAKSSESGGASLWRVGMFGIIPCDARPGLHPMILDNWLAQRAETCPDRMAVIADGVELTYEELEAEATRAARRLAARGVRRGAGVAVTRRAGLEYVVLIHALMKLGAVLHPLNPGLAPSELEAELERIGPALVVSEADHATMSEADLPLLGEHDLDAVNCRILTSGTSGRPRAVGLTYGNHLWSAVGSAFNLGADPADRWLCCLPLYHVAGLEIVMRSVIYGTGAVVHDGFDPGRVAESLERDGIALASLVTTQLVRLLAAGVDLSRPRAILVGGGPVPMDVLGDAMGRG